MRKSFFFCSVILLMLATLSGCGNMPALTSDQEEMVSEYAASLLLKYDSENHTRLVPEAESFIALYDLNKEMHDKAEEDYYNAILEEENKRIEEDRTQQEQNQAYMDSTSNNSSSESEGSTNDGTGGATVVDARPISDILGLSGFSFDYAGADVMKVYPEDAEDASVTVIANNGADLLVVYFNVCNNSSSVQNLDMLGISPIVKLSVNKGAYNSVMKSFHEDDLVCFNSDFEAGETKRLILVTEVREGTVVSNLDMRISHGGDSITKSLR